MDVRELNYLNKQTMAIVKIVSVIICKADKKVFEARQLYKNDIPEVYRLWEQKKSNLMRKIEDTLFKPYTGDTSYLSTLEDYLNILENKKEVGSYENDPILIECMGFQLEGDICLPNVQEL